MTDNTIPACSIVGNRKRPVLPMGGRTTRLQDKLLSVQDSTTTQKQIAETKLKAEQGLAAVGKDGEDFNFATSALCGQDSAQLHADRKICQVARNIGKRKWPILPMGRRNTRSQDKLLSVQDSTTTQKQIAKMKLKAEQCLVTLGKSGEDFNLATSALCGQGSAKLRAMLLADGKIGQVATVQQMFDGHIQTNPYLSQHLVIVGGCRILPALSVVPDVEEATKSFKQSLVCKFVEVMEGCFTAPEQHRFMKRGAAYVPLVLALNGLEKTRLTFLLNSGGYTTTISAEQMRNMVKYCLSTCVAKYINCDCANAAYSIIVKGCQNSQFDLVHINTGVFCQTKMVELCVNAMASIGYVQKDIPTWHPSFYQETINDESNVKFKPFNVCVVHNFAPKSFKDEVQKRMNELSFLVGCGGKKNAWLRSASILDNPAPLITTCRVML